MVFNIGDDSFFGKNVYPSPRRSVLGTSNSSIAEAAKRKDKKRRKKWRFPYLVEENKNRLAKLKDTEWYSNHAIDSLYEVTEDGQDCVPMHDWQTTSFPTCSTMHELSLPQNLRENRFGYLTKGGYNTIFWIMGETEEEKGVLKILSYDSAHTDRNHDRVRRDALISERLTFSPYIMDMYAYCGHALLVPYSPQSLTDNLPSTLTKQERFQHASTVAYALANAHNIDGDGVSSVTHGDFVLRQFNKVGDHFQLGDFNRGRFLRWDKRANKTCTYNIGVNDKTVRK